MPKCPKSPCSFQKTSCSFHSFEPILSKRAKKKSPENPLVYWTFWRRVRDSNPRFLLGTQHFECCTFDHSDNSPYSDFQLFDSITKPFYVQGSNSKCFFHLVRFPFCDFVPLHLKFLSLSVKILSMEMRQRPLPMLNFIKHNFCLN